ncbi:hypothetical protein FXB39_07360 [Nocardioides sp. BGMRC 2183]|nr:hypothetical protein FXB39_07360 [Nocardioides sp. BGMRC 2183]
MSPNGSASDALERPVDLVAHIGSGKTGTSSVQHFMRDNRSRLADRGILYPRSPGKGRHVRVGLYVKSDPDLLGSFEWPRQEAANPTVFRRQVRRRLLREIRAAAPDRVIISDEGLFGASGAALGRFRDLAGLFARSIHLVVYLRRQDDHLVSRYQQAVKTGEVRRLVTWAQQDFSGYYDYFGRLEEWQREIEPASFVVRAFEADRFVGGSLFDDYLDAVGAGIDAAALSPVTSRNPSLDAEQVEFLRLLNLWRVRREGATVGRINNRALLPRLYETSGGPTLTLPDADLDRFMARWQESNRAVAARFLRAGIGDELFGSPRKQSGTTSDQRLSSATAGRYAEAVGLDPRQRDGVLRLIAEE